jgi:predicted metal-dependent enzyme (double-stranded beta helix superfamily)
MAPIQFEVTNRVREFMDRALDSREFSLAALDACLRDVAWYSPRDRRAMRTLCDRAPGRFTRWLFAHERDARYTGLIMVWPPGYSSSIHDHAGLWGIELVLQGSLGVDDYEQVGGTGEVAEMRLVGTTLLREGETASFLGSATHAHRCRNLSNAKYVVTLHVYGGLLGTYRRFEQRPAGAYLARPHTAVIDGRLGPVAATGATIR